MPDVKRVKRIGYSDIYTLKSSDTTFFYQSGMEIDADGGYHAYHPDGKSGLDLLGNAGGPSNWWALVTDTGKPNGKPVIQKDADPAPGFYISTTSLEDTSCNRKDPHRYVNAERINFIVLPGGLNLGAKLGDFAVALRPATGAYDYAVYADVGPRQKLGEASIALAGALGIDSNPRTGGVAHGILYFVFPGSAKQWPLSQAGIDQYGAALFAKWGGVDRAKECFPAVNWA
jgi:Fungal chitosanase of glycosyl hydrolase group 75